MQCRAGCAACCIEISISSPLPGMPEGKPAGVKCVNLTSDFYCKFHNTDLYPQVCRDFTPSEEMCGKTSDQARIYLKKMEELTS